MNDLPETLEQLAARLDTLERRMDALEHPAGAPAPQPAAMLQSAPAAESLPFAQSGGVFSMLGKAMLGIAGAYVLRAVAESDALPRLAVAAVAIVYAILWLVWSARAKAGEWLASTIYACTSALILAPMLYELTLRFNVLAPSITAAILASFVLVASFLAWKRDLTQVAWVANITASLTALALAAATHDLLPFIATLLLMVIVCEAAACRNRELSVRPLVAASADLAIWALVFIYSSAPSTRPQYQPLSTAALIAPACLLFLVYAASVTVRAVVQKRAISAFEIGQAMIAFLLTASSLLYFEALAGAAALGAICLILSGAGYTVACVLLFKVENRRNARVFATWSAALFLAGSWLLVPPSWLPACLGLAALVSTGLGLRLGRRTLQVHGLLFLAAAAVASGLPVYAFNALAATLPGAPPWGVCLVGVCAVLCYAGGNRSQPGQRGQQFTQLIPAVIAFCAIASLLVQGLLRLAALGMVPGAHHVAFVRTFTVCALALLLAFAGSRWQRTELTWLAYATLVFAAAKLLFEDLRLGHLAFIAASIFVFAVTLLAVPRLARMGQHSRMLPLKGVQL